MSEGVDKLGQCSLGDLVLSRRSVDLQQQKSKGREKSKSHSDSVLLVSDCRKSVSTGEGLHLPLVKALPRQRCSDQFC